MIIRGSFMGNELWATWNKFRYNMVSGINFRFLKKDHSIYIYVRQNKAICQHVTLTSYKHDLHLPSTSITLVQRGVLHSGSKIFNHLPHHIKKLSNNFKLFKSELKTFLLENTCYSIEEFFQIQSETG